MSESVFQQPTLEQLDGFVAGDPLIIDEVMVLLLPQIYRWATKYYSDLPVSEVQSVINQVLAETSKNHGRYSPHRSKLTTYIIHKIKLRMIDLYYEVNKVAVEKPGLDEYENLLILPYNDSNTVDSETTIARDDYFQEVSFFLDDIERDFLTLMRQGEKRLTVFAQALARNNQVVVDPERAVKNTKERLLRKLKAIADERNYSFDDLLNK